MSYKLLLMSKDNETAIRKKINKLDSKEKCTKKDFYELCELVRQIPTVKVIP